MVCMPSTACPCTRPCPSVDTVSQLMSAGEAIRFRRGDQLWRKGDPASHVIAVCTGMLRLAGTGDELPPIFELVHRGQIVGEEAVLVGMQRASTCSAVSHGKAMRISRDKINAMMLADPQLCKVLLQTSIRRTGSLTRRMEEVTTGSVRSRLARVLLRLGDEIGLDDARGCFVPAPLKRGDLAELISCRVETVIRTMTDWQRKGILETHREGFVISEPDLLLQDASVG